MHQKTKREFLCRNSLFTGSYFAFASVNKSRHFHSLIIMSIDKSFENSIENILNHPYLNRITEYMLVVLTLNFFLFEPKFVLVFRLTRLSSSRRLAGMTADLIACQMSSCLCQDYNILLVFKHKRDILYTGNVEYILLCLCLQQKNYKD